MRSVPALLLVSMSLSLAGCPGGGDSSAPAGGRSDDRAADAAVREALAKRPDLATNRVFVLGLDGLDPELLQERIAKGRCPNFRRLVEEGASGPLRSQAPMLSPLLWTTIATGQFPTEHGVLDFLVRGEKAPSRRESVTSVHRRVEAMWDIAGRFGRTVGLVGWLASHPAERVNGFAVSERNEQLAYLFHQDVEASAEGKTWPPELVDRVRALRRPPAEVPYAEVAPFLGEVTEEEYRAACAKDEFDDERRTNDLRLVYAATENFRRVGTTLYRERRPALFCLYLEEIDAVSHFTMAFREPVTWKPKPLERIAAAVPDLPADLVERICAKVRGEDPEGPAVVVPREHAEAYERDLPLLRELVRFADPERSRRWAPAVDAAYDHVDRILGEVLGLLDRDSVLIVLSDHGFAFGDGRPPYAPDNEKPPFDSSFYSRFGGAAYHRLDGFLGIHGKGVKRGFSVPAFDPRRPGAGARLVDICPTVLALMGFPRAGDMSGRVLSECFAIDLTTGSVATYERGRAERLARERVEREERRRLSGGEDPTEEAEIRDAMKSLEAVGYVGSAEEGPGRAMMHLAASYREQGRLAEAEEALRECLKSAPAAMARAVRVELGDLLLEKGDLVRAEAAFQEVLGETGSDAPGALLGLALLREGKGDRAGALDCWERLVRAAPGNPLFKVRLASALRDATPPEDPKRPEVLRRALALVEDAAGPEGRGEPDFSSLAPVGRNTRGLLLLDLGRYEEARAEFRAAADRAKEYVRPRTNLGVLEMRLAAQDLQSIPEAPDAARADALREGASRHRAEALRWLGETLAVDPANARAHLNRAEVFAGLPPLDLKAAEEELDLALQADRDYARAKELLEKVRAARGGGK